MMLYRKDAINTGRPLFGVPVLIVLSGVCASILMFWITNHGPGVSPDSTTYIEAARSLLAGKGFFAEGEPMTHYPPAYPFLLSVAGYFLHGDVLQAARLLAVIFFGANILLLGLAVQMCTGQSLLATVCGIFIFLFSAPNITIHSMAWSEAPFITFSMAALILYSLHIVRPSRLFLLVPASLMCGFAIVTRYAGVALLPPIVFTLLFLGDRPVRHRFRDIVIALTIASIPLASWLIRNILTAQTLTNRTFAVHLFSFEHAKDLIITLHDFVLPLPFNDGAKVFNLGLAVGLLITALILLHRKNDIRRNASSFRIAFPVLSIIFSVTYIIFLVISVSFFDAYTPLDARILLPVWFALIVAGLSIVWSLSRAIDQRWIWHSTIFIALLFIIINARLSVLEAIDIHNNGRGYTSLYWQSSDITSYLTDISDDRKIYSNAPDIIRFLTEKEATMIPNKVSTITLKTNEDYEDQLSRMFLHCREGKALVVYLNEFTWRWYLPSIEELESKGKLPIMREFSDGVVYGL